VKARIALGAPLMLQAHQLASKRASCDLSTLSAPDGHEEHKPVGPEQRKAIRFTDSLVEVAYVCESCGTEIKRGRLSWRPMCRDRKKYCLFPANLLPGGAGRVLASVAVLPLSINRNGALCA
jgi:hypothetical protein